MQGIGARGSVNLSGLVLSAHEDEHGTCFKQYVFGILEIFSKTVFVSGDQTRQQRRGLVEHCKQHTGSRGTFQGKFSNFSIFHDGRKKMFHVMISCV